MEPKVTMIMVMSLDGIICREGETDVENWTSLEDKEYFKVILGSFDAILTGRKSFYGLMTERPHYVLSKNAYELNKNTSETQLLNYIEGDAGHIIKKISEKGAKKIALLGGPETNHHFLDKNLVDEIYLTIEPALWGRGKHLSYQENLNISLKLQNIEKLNSKGTLLLKYKVDKKVEIIEKTNYKLDEPIEIVEGQEDECIDINRAYWNERAIIHEKSNYYNVDSLVNGGSSLLEYEVEELGCLRSKKLIHLQCHIGTETVSLAKLGAHVTGVDFSSISIDIAKNLATKCNVNCRFICSDVYNIKDQVGKEKYNIAYVNFGAITLLPDLKKWAKIIYELLSEDGFLYLNELHPIAASLSSKEPKIIYNYFNEKPKMWVEPGSYADGVDGRYTKETKNNKLVVWDWTLGTIVSTLASQGFIIEYLHEFAGHVDKRYEYLVKGNNLLWYSPKDIPAVPATFSIKAKKKIH